MGKGRGTGRRGPDVGLGGLEASIEAGVGSWGLRRLDRVLEELSPHPWR